MDKPLQPKLGRSCETSEPCDSNQEPKYLVSARPKDKQPSRDTIATISSANPSRESSPARSTRLIRPHPKTAYSVRATISGAGAGSSRSRIVTQDLSAAGFSNPPSAAATQRAFSANSISTLHPVSSDLPLKSSISQKALLSPEVKEHPRWPISPRLRSPPPINLHSILSPRKPDAEPIPTTLRRSHSVNDDEKPSGVQSELEDPSSLPGMRTPARGVSGASTTLETVQEISQPSTPASSSIREPGKSRYTPLRQSTDQMSASDCGSSKIIKPRASIILTENNSENTGRSDLKTRVCSVALPSVTRSSNSHSKPYGSGGLGRGKPSAEGSARNMTVETETVSSIPQIPVGAGGPGNGGSIRTKPSSETIRPRKERKKTIRKPPSLTSGTASSKADIFEAKVASAVDEANSSDSEETFVYESNPPDANDRPRRFHSRTPSATSMASQVDQRNGVRAIMDGHIVVVKKSMKFANSYNSANLDVAGEDAGKGSARSNIGTSRGTTQHHHLNIRWGRYPGNNHSSIFDNESPFTNAATSKLSGSSSRFSSQPSSPRVLNSRTVYGGKKLYSSRYDMDDTSDNALTPLLSTVRSGTSARSRRQNGSCRQQDLQVSHRNKQSLSRCGGSLVLFLIMLLVLSGAAGFIFATTQPLEKVKIIGLKNVLVSQQDIIFDMEIQARNPNLVAVTIQYTDLVVFVNSKYVGSGLDYLERPESTKLLRRAYRVRGRDANDPSIEEITRGNSNLEVGHISILDNPLTFEGSPFSNIPTRTSEQILIRSPGNFSAPAGTKRWESILQHEFDIILRGMLKYSLPLNQKVRSISVEGRVTVKTDKADKISDDIAPQSR